MDSDLKQFIIPSIYDLDDGLQTVVRPERCG